MTRRDHAHFCAWPPYPAWREAANPPTAPDRHSACHQERRQAQRQEPQRRAVQQRGQLAAPPGRGDGKPQPQERQRQQRAEAPLEQALGDEWTPYKGHRRSDELHDFDFVTAGVQPQAHDRGHRDGRRDRHQEGQREPCAARRVEAGREPAEPFAVVAHVGDARQLRHALAPAPRRVRRAPPRAAPALPPTPETGSRRTRRSATRAPRTRGGSVRAPAASRRTRGRPPTPLWSITASIAPRCSDVASSRR